MVSPPPPTVPSLAGLAWATLAPACFLLWVRGLGTPTVKMGDMRTFKVGVTGPLPSEWAVLARPPRPLVFTTQLLGQAGHVPLTPNRGSLPTAVLRPWAHHSRKIHQEVQLPST